MNINIHHHHHYPTLHKELAHMSQQMDRLIADVANLTSVDTSAVALLNGFQQRLLDAGTDQDKLTQLASDIEASAGNLSAAVAANTPAAAPAPNPVDPGPAPTVDPGITPTFADGSGAVPNP